MRLKRRHILLLILIAYVGSFFFLAVLGREPMKVSTVRLDLFKGLLEPGATGYRDLVQNVIGFIPVGVLVGLLSKRHRVMIALLVGVLVSMVIEGSQLVWKKGVFDVDDIFNNAVGALIGGVIAWFMVKSSRLRVKVLACCKRHSRAEG